MACRSAWLVLTAALAACDAPPPEMQPRAPQPVVQVQPAAAPSMAQLYEWSEQCGKASREIFQRDWKHRLTEAADGLASVALTNHYNSKLHACFTLLTVSHATDGVRKLLFDVREREPYGEYLGLLAGHPKTCRVEHLHCASSGEWDILASPYMED